MDFGFMNQTVKIPIKERLQLKQLDATNDLRLRRVLKKYGPKLLQKLNNSDTFEASLLMNILPFTSQQYLQARMITGESMPKLELPPAHGGKDCFNNKCFCLEKL